MHDTASTASWKFTRQCQPVDAPWSPRYSQHYTINYVNATTHCESGAPLARSGGSENRGGQQLRAPFPWQQCNEANCRSDCHREQTKSHRLRTQRLDIDSLTNGTLISRNENIQRSVFPREKCPPWGSAKIAKSHWHIIQNHNYGAAKRESLFCWEHLCLRKEKETGKTGYTGYRPRWHVV